MSAMSRPRTVLIVDQDDGWREAVASALKADYRILRASSGESALAMLTREEVLYSINTGLPALEEMARAEGFEAVAALNNETARALKLVPA